MLKEKIEAASATRLAMPIRHRIVKDRGFSQPVHLEQAVESDPASGDEGATVLLSARIANQILLSSIEPTEAVEVADIAQSLGWRIAPQTRSSYFAVLETDEADFNTVEEALEAVSSSGSSLSASPNQIYYTLATPNDPRFSSNAQWGLTQTSDVDIDAPEGWDVRNSAASIIIAIVDTGVRATHEDLRSNLWRNARDATRNGRDDDANGYVDDLSGIDTVNTDTRPDDDNGHGTHVAGIAGAVGNNGKGIAGVAWDVQLMPIKSLNADGRGTSSAIAEGIDYAINNGANLINASWGTESFDHVIEQAIDRARNKGILFVAAAGNDRLSYPGYPASSQSDNVISVGSIDKWGKLSTFSNYSETEVDVLAPGDGVVSTWHEADDAYTNQDGTSMAAAYVSGILALNLAQRPGDDYAYQIQRLLASSKARENLRRYARSAGIVSLAGSLKMSRIPVLPRILSSSNSELSIDEGASATFHVEAESELEISYRWYHNENRLSETSNTLALENVQPSQRGQYVVEVVNADAVVSASYHLEVFPRMREIEALVGAGITIFASHEDHWERVEEEGATAIVNRALGKGVSAYLRFVSQRPGMLQFFGKKPNGPSNSTTTSLSGPDAWDHFTEQSWSQWEARQDLGSGFVAILNHSSSYPNQPTPARSLFLRIPKFFAVDELPPAIRQHPQSSTVRMGETVHLSVSAYGENLKYQWYKDDAPIEGETQRYLRFVVESADNGGTYYVTVTNENASSTSSYAVLDVDTSPQPASVILEDESLTLTSGDPLALSMRVYGAQPIKYQWYKEDIPIPGANGARLNLGPASIAHQGYYRLAVENDLNDYPAFSSHLHVQVSEQTFPPRFSSADKAAEHLRLAEGRSFTLDLGFPVGSSPIDLQWFKDGEPFKAGSRSITFYPVRASLAGTYYLEASNPIGLDQSGRVTIEVTPSLAEAIDYYGLTLDDSRSQAYQTLPIYQVRETWDGEDAIELYSSEQFGTSYLSLANNGERRVLSFRWKIEENTTATLSLSGADDRQLSERGTWNQSTILLEASDSIAFNLRIEDGEGRAWLDRFEVVKAPYLLNDLSFTLPSAGETVVLTADMLGEDLAYQWYKDDVAVTGAIPPSSESINLLQVTQVATVSRHPTLTGALPPPPPRLR